MSARVTAILVVRHGGETLERTLSALLEQSRAVDSVVVALCSDSITQDLFTELHREIPSTVIVALGPSPRSFGGVLRALSGYLPSPESADDTLWLLAEDTAPDEDALRYLEASLVTAPSVAVSSPKLVAWSNPERIVSLGLTLTGGGRTAPILDESVTSGDIDQGQHDSHRDVLGALSAGMLVRHSVWNQLGGFDPALPVVDDGLDFSVRVRLAGFRVEVVPAARVLFQQIGITGPKQDGKARTERHTAALERRAHLHRRLAYSSKAALPFHWISLLPLAIFRSIGLVFAKRFGPIFGELGAAFRVLFSPGKVKAARSAIAHAAQGVDFGWSSISGLRLSPGERNRRRRETAERARVIARAGQPEVRFLDSGGGWVVLIAVLTSIALFYWLLGQSGLTGGGALPLSLRLRELWANATYGWHDAGSGLITAADPFAGILALMGSVTAWAPSLSIIILWLLAIPISALGMWFAVSRLSNRGMIRACISLIWGLAPTLLISLGDGRVGAVIAHVLLGWLAFVALGRSGKLSSLGGGALLVAAISASAPSLFPVLLLAVIVMCVLRPRHTLALLWIPVPALVLFLPTFFEQLRRGNPWAIFADPGVPFASLSPSITEISVGLPSHVAGHVLGISFLSPVAVTTILLVPLLLAAFGSFLTAQLLRSVLLFGFAAAGFVIAVISSRTSLSAGGLDSVTVWPGAGISAMLLGILLAAAVGCDALKRSTVSVLLVATLALVPAIPFAVAIAQRNVAVHAVAERTLPAVVDARAASDPRVTTLRLTPTKTGALQATLIVGDRTTLDRESTVANTSRVIDGRQEELATFAGLLVTRSTTTTVPSAESLGVQYILLVPAGDGREEIGIHNRAAASLGNNEHLKAVSETDFGRLWSIPATATPVAAPEVAGLRPVLIALVQIAILAIAFIVALPFGGATLRNFRRKPNAATPVEEPIDLNLEADTLDADLSADEEGDPDVR